MLMAPPHPGNKPRLSKLSFNVPICDSPVLLHVPRYPAGLVFEGKHTSSLACTIGPMSQACHGGQASHHNKQDHEEGQDEDEKKYPYSVSDFIV